MTTPTTFTIWDADESVLLVRDADRNVAVATLLGSGVKPRAAIELLDHVATDPDGMAHERYGITVQAST